MVEGLKSEQGINAIRVTWMVRTRLSDTHLSSRACSLAWHDVSVESAEGRLVGSGKVKSRLRLFLLAGSMALTSVYVV